MLFICKATYAGGRGSAARKIPCKKQRFDLDYFSFHYSAKKSFSRKLEKLFGKPRAINSDFFTEASGFPSYFGQKPENYTLLCEQNQYYADIAASIQSKLCWQKSFCFSVGCPKKKVR